MALLTVYHHNPSFSIHKKIELDQRKSEASSSSKILCRPIECHAEATLLIQTKRRNSSKYRIIYHLQEELSRTQAVQVSFFLAKHDFLAKVLGGIFLSFQRGSKDFLDIDLYFYTIWFEFSRKKSGTDRTSHLCQVPSNLESSKKMDGSKLPKKQLGA